MGLPRHPWVIHFLLSTFNAWPGNLRGAQRNKMFVVRIRWNSFFAFRGIGVISVIRGWPVVSVCLSDSAMRRCAGKSRTGAATAQFTRKCHAFSGRSGAALRRKVRELARQTPEFTRNLPFAGAPPRCPLRPQKSWCRSSNAQMVDRFLEVVVSIRLVFLCHEPIANR